MTRQIAPKRSSIVKLPARTARTALNWSLGAILVFLTMPGLGYSQMPSKMAYSQNDGVDSSSTGSQFEIYTIDPDGTNPLNLTNNPGNDRLPAFSPDGSRIAFVSDRDGFYEIYTMNADGSDVLQLTDGFASLTLSPTYSPDGTKIAFQYNNNLWLMDSDGSNKVQLTNDGADYRQPAFSPDGTKISFVRFSVIGQFEIYIMNLDASGQTRLTFSDSFDLNPEFSIDGSSIAFGSFRDGDFEIYTMNADGTFQQNITNSPGGDFHPFYSPDGTKIAFISNRDATEQIYVMNPDGSNQTQITFNPEGKLEVTWGLAADADGDGVPDSIDVCADTELPDVEFDLKKNRYAANADGEFIDAEGTSSGYTIVDTGGCSASQIIEAGGFGGGHERFGITRSVLEYWIAMLPPQ